MASVHAALHDPPSDALSYGAPSDKTKEDEPYPCPLQTRVYPDEKCMVEDQSLLEHGIALFTLALYTSWPYILFILLLLSFVPAILILNLFIASTLLLPCPLFSEAFLNLEIFRLWRQYFSFSYYMEEVLQHITRQILCKLLGVQKLSPRRRYLFAEFPHGTFPIGPLLAGTLITKMFPGEKIYSLAADVLFKIPLYRHFMCMLGSQPADKKHFNALISKASVAIVVGGIAEMFMQHETKEQVLLSRRKGFVRLALTNGVDIVPVFHFGNSRILSIGPKSLIDLCRKMRISVGIMVGRWGLPIPKPHPIYMVVGRPVKVESAVSADDPNFKEAVDKLHEKVIEELTRIYNAHKDKFGWKDRPLEIPPSDDFRERETSNYTDTSSDHRHSFDVT